MKRLLIIIFILLLCPSASAGGGMLQDIVAGQGAPSITFLLNCFSGTVADQSYTNEQVIDTAAEGCTAGSLSVLIAGVGSVSASSNSLITNGGGSWVRSPLLGPTISRTRGTALFAHSKPASGYSLIGFSTNATYPDGSLANIESTLVYNNGSFEFGSDTAAYAPGIGYTNNREYQIAIIIGGSPSGNNGASWFFKHSTEYPSWTLVWKEPNQSSANLSLVLDNYGNGHTLSNIKIPNYDFSSVLQPAHLSTFTGVDSTSIASATYTPDSGPGWTVQSGAASIQTNKAQFTTAGVATFEAGTPTVLYDAKLTMPASGTTGGGMLARWADATHYFYVQAVTGDTNNVKLIEANGSEPGDTRSTASATLSASTEYRFRLIVDSASPYWSIFVNEVAKGTYTTVGSSSTATKFGLKDEGDSNMVGFDVVALWPRTSTTYTTEFAKVGY